MWIRLIKCCFLPFLVVLFSCGGGPYLEDIGIENTSSRVIVDLCKESEEGGCDIEIPEPLFTVTLKSAVSQTSYGDINQAAYQVTECKFQWVPLNEWTLEENPKFSCNYPIIPAGGEATLEVSIASDLVEELRDYYMFVGKTLSYRLKVTIVVRPFYGGEEKEVTTYLDIDFLDLPD